MAKTNAKKVKPGRMVQLVDDAHIALPKAGVRPWPPAGVDYKAAEQHAAAMMPKPSLEAWAEADKIAADKAMSLEPQSPDRQFWTLVRVALFRARPRAPTGKTQAPFMGDMKIAQATLTERQARGVERDQAYAHARGRARKGA